MIELLFLGSAAFAGGAHAVRRSRARTPARGNTRPRRDSLLVKAWNSSGAPHTNESMLGDALADLTGRAIGTTVRRTAPRARNRGRAARARAESRWQRRRDEGRTVTIFRRRNRPGQDPGKGSGQGSGGPKPDGNGGAGKRPQNAPPLPLPNRPAPHPSRGPGGAAPGSPGSGAPTPPPSPPTAPAPPRPASHGSAPSGGAAGGWGRIPAGRGRGGSPAGSPARRAGARRARARMRMAAPLNLESPDTDVEFLDSCADLLHVLRGIGVAIEDFNDELDTRRLPRIVTGPLEHVHEGLVEGAATVVLATVLFENAFAEAREIAAAGIEFTGDDPE
ncbi:hypothetical protein [Actinomadura rifamycini]|uniref:hypothetical protein n=1 Tax=Actinomadura rifamycini TaxID=31962 RepID=UPI000479D632|nr:hypothetical protein [Actinomadura rifamycini]